MRIISYNVNGIRAAMGKGLAEWLKATDADVLCLQEIKATPDVVDSSPFSALGYELYWYPAEKKGYSGTAIFTRHRPDHVEYGTGMKAYDAEGRFIRIDLGELSIMSTYFPSGTTGDLRQDFKYRFLDDFYEYIQKLRKKRPQLIIGGDYNICHRPIDIHNPVSNASSSGFLPEERAWMSKFIQSGFIDTFRHFNPEPHQYTWWSFRANARAKNLGWRIDYNMASESLSGNLKRAAILPEAKHSDHCPVLLELK
ncbi:MAG: exodeoxyribonuclease III [Bacteroidia bacterium]|nr:exodeoxyribonuclease III [Bacteroidia bacterium]